MTHRGCLPDTPSDKDYLYGAVNPTASPADVPGVWRRAETLIGPVDNQGSVPTCVCHAAAGLMAFLSLGPGRILEVLEFDADDLFRQCQRVDGQSGSGTTPRIAMDALRTEGMLASDHARRRIQAAVRLLSAADIKHAIAFQGPVLVGLPLSTLGLETMGPDAIVPLTTEFDLHHAMLATGYDDNRQAFRLRNCWGPEWGDNGYCWLPYRYLSLGGRFDAWTAYSEVSR